MEKIDTIRAVIRKAVEPRARQAGVDLDAIGDETDLFLAGVIDSFGFLDLLEEIETGTGTRVDLADLEDEGLGTIGGLARQIAGIGGRDGDPA